MNLSRCPLALVLLLVVSTCGCVVSVRTPVEEGPMVVELFIGESVVVRGHEIECIDINIFGTSAILSIDGVEVMVKDLGDVDLPQGVDDISVRLVTLTDDFGTHSIELSIEEV